MSSNLIPRIFASYEVASKNTRNFAIAKFRSISNFPEKIDVKKSKATEWTKIRGMRSIPKYPQKYEAFLRRKDKSERMKIQKSEKLNKIKQKIYIL